MQSDSPSIENLLNLALTRNPPLTVSEHQKLALICAVTCYRNRDLDQAQSFLDDAVCQAQNLGLSVEPCLYWQAVLKYERGDFLGCKSTCESLFARPDLPLDLLASVALLLSNTLPLLPVAPLPRLTLPPSLAPAATLLPHISKSQISDLGLDHLRRARAAFGLTYVARLAEAISTREISAHFRSDAAFLNVASHYELRPEFLTSYARVTTTTTTITTTTTTTHPLVAQVVISGTPPLSVAEVVGKRISTTKVLLALGKPEMLGPMTEEVVESGQVEVGDRLRFWAAKARSTESEEERFAAARKLALIADDVHDFRLLEEAVALASEFSGPQSVFYKDLQEMLRKFDGRKSEIYFLPANPPGLGHSGPPTPRASEAARRSSRVSTGGMPALSPWKPSLAELSP